MIPFTKNIHPTVVVKTLHYLLETSDKYQHRNIHIDDTWFQQICFSISENIIYQHSVHRTENSVTKTNMPQTYADVDNSDDDYLEENNNEAFVANRTQCWIAQLQTSNHQHTHLIPEKAKLLCSMSPLQNTPSFPQFSRENIKILCSRYTCWTQCSKYILEVKTSTDTEYPGKSLTGSEM